MTGITLNKKNDQLSPRAAPALKTYAHFDSLTEQEVLALAIALEEENERGYSDFAENFRKDFPATASMFEGMRDEESTHWRKLIDLYREQIWRTHTDLSGVGT